MAKKEEAKEKEVENKENLDDSSEIEEVVEEIEEEKDDEGSLEALILGRIARRAVRADQKLKSQLSGTIQVKVKDTKKNFLLDGKNNCNIAEKKIRFS